MGAEQRAPAEPTSREQWVALGEAFRNRARSGAALTASGAAAIAAGFTLAPGASGLSDGVFVCGILSAVLLLAGTVAFTRASLYSQDRKVSRTEMAAVNENTMRTIREWTAWGARLSCSGVVLIVVALGWMGVLRLFVTEASHTVAVTGSAHRHLQEACPSLSNPFVAYLDLDQLTAASSTATLVRLEIDAKDCSGARASETTQWIWVHAADIVQAARD